MQIQKFVFTAKRTRVPFLQGSEFVCLITLVTKQIRQSRKWHSMLVSQNGAFLTHLSAQTLYKNQDSVELVIRKVLENRNTRINNNNNDNNNKNNNFII